MVVYCVTCGERTSPEDSICQVGHFVIDSRGRGRSLGAS